jgi:lactate permease
MGAVQYIVVVWLGLWNLGAFGGGLAGLILSIWLIRKWSNGDNVKGKTGMPMLLAMAAYLILIVLTIVILLVPAINDWMGSPAIEIPFPETKTSQGFISPAATNRPIHPFTHAGAILLYASLIAYFLYRHNGLYQAGSTQRILGGTIRSMMSSSISILEMVAMASIMAQSGMTEALALGLANFAGPAFSVIAPWIGAIGAFITGSNTNSNVIFTGLQLRTAQLLAYNPAIILAAQTAGAGLASIAAPTKVVVGASTAGMAGKEGEVLRALIGYTLFLILFVSLLSGLGILLVG